MARIDVEIGGLKIKNPTMSASGILDNTSDLLIRLFKGGAGAVVTKSVGKYPREPYPGPNVVEMEFGILNAMGLPNPGVEYFSKEVMEAKKKCGGIVIVGSVYGKDQDEFLEVASKMEEAGCDAIELNLSCPHVKGYGAEIGRNPKAIKEICEISESLKLPVFAKLTPNVTDIVSLASAALDGGVSGIVAINSVRAMRINVELMRPVLGHVYGAYSGKGILPIGVRAVYDIYEELNCDIVGLGGITNYLDALEYILAGAKAVQIGTAIMEAGEKIFCKIAEGINRWLEDHGFNSIYEVIGAAHKS